MRAFKASIIFSNQIPKYSLGVLGNEGFFNKFKVEFDYKNKQIDVE